MSLSTKYRPHKFEDVVSQKSIVKILQRQISSGDIHNCYLFTGPSGTGKTTLGRIFANEVNNNIGVPIEIDGASNNSVDNVRHIVSFANERAVDGKYKVFIIDECHMLTISAWNAFLKCIEEPPKYTIFIFCTTDPQKIPNTILNRVQRFNLNKIPNDKIKSRLEYICRQEGYSNYDECINYITNISNGGMRDAIANLEKVADYSNDLSITNTIEALGDFSLDTFISLTKAIAQGDEKNIIQVIEDGYMNGQDLKLFIQHYLSFCLDVTKYTLFGDVSMTNIPMSYEEDVKKITSFSGNSEYFMWLTDNILEIMDKIKYDSNIRTTIEVMLLKVGRMQS